MNELISAFEDTRKISLTELKNQTWQLQQATNIYREGFLHQNSVGENTVAAQIIVEENTSFAAARKFIPDFKTAVLNFANPENPGGGVLNGARAQEESLCRSSNLYEALIGNSVYVDYYLYHRELHNRYYSDRLIYSRGVTVFKDDSDIPMLLPPNECFNVDVITCAAPYLAGETQVNTDELKAIFKSRIKNIFEAAIDNGIRCIILGAFGCGAFKNPPEIVASAFHEAIFENHYELYFDYIVFAIKSSVRDNEGNCPNLEAFRKEFCGNTNNENKKVRMIMGEDNNNEYDLLSEGIRTYKNAKSNEVRKAGFKLIIKQIFALKFYVPVNIDLKAMFGNANPADFKVGDNITNQEDVRVRLLTYGENGKEFLPLFTSSAEAHKGPTSSLAKMSLTEYLPFLVEKKCAAIINPFGDDTFIIDESLVNDLFVPLVFVEATNEGEQNNTDKFIGTKINNDYLIKEKIDEDSITKTYLAENKYGIACAVKVIDKKKDGKQHSRWFFEEVRKNAMLLSNLDHPFVPRMMDCIESDDCIYVITRYITGKMLDRVIKEQGILPEETAIKIAVEIAEALKYIHNLPRPLIHRDVKPGSIMVTDTNAVLFDFDIAIEYTPNKPASVLGTPGFAAPEQYTEYFDTRVDIYGLGATLYCMLTNDDLRELRVKQPMTKFNKSISRELEAIIDKCVAVNPNDRYQNCDEVIAALVKYSNNSAKKRAFKNFFNKR